MSLLISLLYCLLNALTCDALSCSPLLWRGVGGEVKLRPADQIRLEQRVHKGMLWHNAHGEANIARASIAMHSLEDIYAIPVVFIERHIKCLAIDNIAAGVEAAIVELHADITRFE